MEVLLESSSEQTSEQKTLSDRSIKRQIRSVIPLSFELHERKLRNRKEKKDDEENEKDEEEVE